MRYGIGVLALALFTVPGSLRGQDVQLVGDEDLCTTCELSLEHVVRLGDREGPGRVMQLRAMARDPEGRYWVAHPDGAMGGASRIWIFDSAGVFVRTIGRRGEGPGEYGAITRIRFRRGDTVEIYSGDPRRRTVLGPDRSVVSTNPVPLNFMRSVFLPDGRAMLVDHMATPDRAGYPLQLVEPSGEVVRSLGAVEPEYDPREPMRLSRVVAAGPDGGSVWTVGRGDYRIELWDTTGTRRAVLQRDADWFEPYVLGTPLEPDGPPPPPQVSLMTRDAEGRLWIAVLVAADDWRAGFSRAENGRYEPQIAQIYDTILEVVEPSTGRLLASRRFTDHSFSVFLDGSLIVSYEEDEAGYPFLDVWRFSLDSVEP